MANLFACTIISRTGFALAIDANNPGPGGQLILDNADETNPDQQWVWIYVPAIQSNILYNSHKNLYAAPQALQKDSPVILFSGNPSGISGDNTWQIAGDDHDVIRISGDEDLNLNALGNDYRPGTRVGVYTWSRGGGHPNQYWVSKLVRASSTI